MAADDYYEILGIPRNASDDQIKRAYRQAAKKFHPDRNPGDRNAEAKFKKAQEAYDVLGNKDKRAQYDRFGKAGVGRVEDVHGRKVYTWGQGSRINLDELDDLFTAFGGEQQFGGANIFEQLFGKRSRGGGFRGATSKRRPAARGKDVERTVELTFEQAVRGTSVDIDVIANGRQDSGRQVLTVKIPPGVDDGQRIRLAGKGQPGQGGAPPGDLYIACRLKPHAFFRRKGRDIYLDVPISITEAVLGAKVDVPTLDGFVTVTIPPGTSSGAKLRLRGRGIRNDRGRTGDQIVVVQIVPPQNLNDRQREAVRALDAELRHDPRLEAAWAQGV